MKRLVLLAALLLLPNLAVAQGNQIWTPGGGSSLTFGTTVVPTCATAPTSGQSVVLSGGCLTGGAGGGSGTVTSFTLAPTSNQIVVSGTCTITTTGTCTFSLPLSVILAAGGSFCSSDTGSPCMTLSANSIGFNQSVTFASTQGLFTGVNGTCNTAPASGSSTLCTETTNGWMWLDSSSNKHYSPIPLTCTNQFLSAFAANGTLTCSGLTAGEIPVVNTVVDTGTPVSVSSTNPAEFHFNENATAATAVTYNLPTAAAGKQFCFSNANNGSAANTGVLTVATSATGQFIIFTDGTLSATGGNVTSGGAAGDAACFVGVDSTHWAQYTQRGTWTKH